MTSARILTSQNAPLRIASVPVGARAGAVGITLCPGKWQADSSSGAWQRDLLTDLGAIAGWGAAAVVSLMPAHELQAVRAADIGENCELLEMEWYHLPIRDVDVPDAAFEAAWVYAGLRLRHHLRQGRNVLLHCRGGLGRSGMIAARLLAELGWTAADAIAAVRAQRPGAIQTAAQERHVRQHAQPIDAETDAGHARVLGCILGGAVGDAFGYEIEFANWPAIQRAYGPAGLQEPVLHGGQLVVSDDTQMSLFTLEALTLVLQAGGSSRACQDVPTTIHALRQAYLRWGETQGLAPASQREPQATLHLNPAMRQRRAPGNTCMSAVRSGALGGCTRPVNDSKGCGAVMRTAPIGLIEGIAPELALKLGCMAGALTHGHLDGWAPAGVMAALVQRLNSGMGLDDACEKVLALCTRTLGHDHADTMTLARAALRLATDNEPLWVARAALGQGWTGDEALAIALHAVLSQARFEDVIRVAANHDGDSDSTASIAGQLWGTYHGILGIPHRWIRHIDVLLIAAELTSRFLAHNTADSVTRASMNR